MEALKKGGKLVISFGEDVPDEIEAQLLLLRSKSLIANFELDPDANAIDTITDGQRNKIIVMIKEFGVNYGNDLEDMKEEFKIWFGRGDFSLSNCSKSLADDFITFIISKIDEAGYEITYDAADEFCKQSYAAIKTKTCVVDGTKGKVYENTNGKQICLCDKCKKELDLNPEEFIKNHHIILITK